MLKELHISNYALIDNTNISFDNGMSVITGETGAGKSILLGALGLLLGQRADTQVLSDKDKKCVVEATFDVAAHGLQHIFAENDVDYDDLTIVRREIMPSGKSRAFVNDCVANLAFLKEIGSKLIDIHSQHQNLLLSDGSFHLMVTDAVAGTAAQLADYSAHYTEYRKLLASQKQLAEDNERLQRDADYLAFQHKQLKEATLAAGEEQILEAERDRLTHSEEIKTELTFAISALEGDDAIVPQLAAVLNKLQKISQFLPQDADVVNRIEAARVDLSDVWQTLQKVSEGVEYNPERLMQVEQRLDLIYSLQQKHHLQSVEELIALCNELEQKLLAIESFDHELAEIQKKIEAKRQALNQLSTDLSTARRAVFDDISNHIEAQLRDMGMENARFVVQCQPADDFLPTGLDQIRFLFAANKNGEPTEISRVASGGEISRVMLSIKSLLSKTKGLPTIIFDEIDTGVSGNVADRMGEIMTDMSQHMQVIAITHLPQVAAKGRTHFKVFKTDNAERTTSNILKLNTEERTTELAQMLSGARITEAALQNARELLCNNHF